MSRTRKDFKASTDRISTPKVKKNVEKKHWVRGFLCLGTTCGELTKTEQYQCQWAMEHRIIAHTMLLIGSIPRSPLLGCRK